MKDEIASRLKYWAFRFEGKGVQESQASDAMHAASLHIEQLVGIVAELRVKAFSDAELLDNARGDAERWKQAYHDALAGGDALKAEVERLSKALRLIRDQGGDVVERWSSEFARKALEGAP